MEKKKVKLPIIVEGKYDKNTLSQLFDALIISTDGFGVFNSEEKRTLIRRLSQNGIIVLTDSDAGGRQIRNFLGTVVPKDKIFNLYIPKIEGKEKRKTKRSKEGILGVEGMSPEILFRIFEKFTDEAMRAEKKQENDKKMITKVDFFLDGLSGARDAVMKRGELARKFDLPPTMSAAALIEALNLLFDYDSYKKAVLEIQG